MTLKVAEYYYNALTAKADNTYLLSLETLPVWNRNEELLTVEQKLLIPSEKFVFIMPEYNGSFPGVLKMMIDNSDIKKCWWHKKAAIIGIADGRGGNLRGIDHFTGILHYLKMNVLYNKLPISKIREEMSEDGNWLNMTTEALIQQHIGEFLKY